MRIVRSLADLPGEVAKATAEAESAFGDGTVFVETYVERGRHVARHVDATEQRLQLVANDLTLLIDTANAPIFGIEASGKVNEWNKKACHL